MDQPITPDWSALPDEILCPLCRYNLRGLVEPRCPECGYSFDWSEVLDPNRRLHPYLFEHHPERNVWSFFRTLVGGLRPWRFWSTLHPAQPADARRLTLYHLLICALLLLPALTRLVAVTYFPTPAANYDWDDGDLDDVIDTAISKSPGPALVWWFLLPVYRWKAGLVLWGLPVLGLLMPYAMVLPLSVFQWSMHKARVGYEHGLCAWMWRGTGRSSHWQWRWTGIGLAVLVLMFAAGTAAVGVAHQTAWLLSSPRPMFKYGSGRLDLVRCQSNLRQLHQCIAIYHSDHGQYPERLADLVDAGILEYPEVLICPASSDEAAPGPTTRQRVEQLAEPRHQSYIYVPRALKTDAASTNPSSRTDRFDEVVIYEKLHHHDGGGIHVLYTDGTTEYLDAERTQRFLASRPAATNPK